MPRFLNEIVTEIELPRDSFVKISDKSDMPDTKRFLENWQNEIDSAAQYHALAAYESDLKIKQVYESLAKAEERHVVFWEQQLTKNGMAVPAVKRPSWRSRLLIALAKRFGSKFVLGTLVQVEHQRDQTYGRDPLVTTSQMRWDEKWHAKVLSEISRTQRTGMEGGFLGRVEGRHRAFGGNALRASVLGANDGLCSNLSLVMGVAGAATQNEVIVLTGFAGLLAGALSMALGEWLSVQSSRELAEREIQIEADEIELDPQAEAEELKLIYEAKGLSSHEAESLANHMMSDKERGLNALIREELGLDPDELNGSPKEAALFSFFLFAIGAVVPVVPFLFLTGASALAACLVLSSLALFGFGALITVFTGKSVWSSGFRQLTLGLVAAAVTHLLGRLLGASLF